jgi:hypothetical protein
MWPEIVVVAGPPLVPTRITNRDKRGLPTASSDNNYPRSLVSARNTTLVLARNTTRTKALVPAGVTSHCDVHIQDPHNIFMELRLLTYYISHKVVNNTFVFGRGAPADGI